MSNKNIVRTIYNWWKHYYQKTFTKKLDGQEEKEKETVVINCSTTVHKNIIFEKVLKDSSKSFQILKI